MPLIKKVLKLWLCLPYFLTLELAFCFRADLEELVGRTKSAVDACTEMLSFILASMFQFFMSPLIDNHLITVKC